MSEMNKSHNRKEMEVRLDMGLKISFGFSTHDYVNHNFNWAILTNYPGDEEKMTTARLACVFAYR